MADLSTPTCAHCRLDRRDFIKIAFGAGAAALGGGLFLPPLGAGEPARRARAVILLWMQGGPSQLDTFDPKPGTETGGPFKAIETRTRGLRICEHLPRLASLTDKLAVVRTLHSRDPNHDTARYFLHTGYRVDSTVEHPHLGSLIAKELGIPAGGLPGCITIGAASSVGAGYLSPDCAPLLIEKVESPLDDLRLAAGVTRPRLEDREGLLAAQNESFAREHGDARLAYQAEAQKRALELMRSSHLKAFDPSDETDETRALYGPSPFGKACLMARRLVEEDVRLVEVTLADWDTHADNFNRTRKLAEQLDAGMAGLVRDLDRRGTLPDVLVLCMGEFGRTPKVNANQGRDHFTRAFSAVLAGGGIAGGRVVGETSADGTETIARPVSVQDLLVTVYGRLGIDPTKEFTSRTGRPIRIVDGGEPIAELLS